MRFDYIDIVRGLIDTIEEREGEHMEQCVELLAECVRDKHSIYTFGASHAGILSEEMSTGDASLRAGDHARPPPDPPEEPHGAARGLRHRARARPG